MAPDPQDRRRKLLAAIEIAKRAGNPFLEANLRQALREHDKAEQAG